MEDIACQYYEYGHLRRVENAAANAELIREIYCNGDPTGCKTFLRMKSMDSKTTDETNIKT